jgi:hypothetical protein
MEIHNSKTNLGSFIISTVAKECLNINELEQIWLALTRLPVAMEGNWDWEHFEDNDIEIRIYAGVNGLSIITWKWDNQCPFYYIPTKKEDKISIKWNKEGFLDKINLLVEKLREQNSEKEKLKSAKKWFASKISDRLFWKS